jgi:hypothetical protein
MSPESLLLETLTPEAIVTQLRAGQFLVVSSRRRNGLILYKSYYADFAGPGAAIGGSFDQTCEAVIPVGNLALVVPTSYEDRQTAYKIRLQWIRLMKRFTHSPVAEERARKVLEQFEQYFDQETVRQISDETLANLVGVLPQTVQAVRSS